MARSNELAEQAKKRVGTVLCNKWTLDRLLDIGGMAAVFAATHRNGNRVAIKMLHPAYAQVEEIRERFLREGYVANKIDHPAALSIHDDDELDDGSVFLVMELLRGMSLEARLSEHKVLPSAEVILIAHRVLDVLAVAHEKSIVHRDIKPANIFLTVDGDVKVLDFGLARVRERTFQGSLTRTGIVMGTASFMPPEQARAKRDIIDHRTDLWAVGATMFRALTGRYVHEGGTVNERFIAAMSQHAPSLAAVGPQLPLPVVEVVDRALKFQTYDRWPSAQAMQEALAEAYLKVEGKPLPVNEQLSWAGGGIQSQVPTRPVDASQLQVSVVYDPEPLEGDSVTIQFDDEGGSSQRVTLKRAAAEAARPVSDESIVELSLSELTIAEVKQVSK